MSSCCVMLKISQHPPLTGLQEISPTADVKQRPPDELKVQSMGLAIVMEVPLDRWLVKIIRETPTKSWMMIAGVALFFRNQNPMVLSEFHRPSPETNTLSLTQQKRGSSHGGIPWRVSSPRRGQAVPAAERSCNHWEWLGFTHQLRLYVHNAIGVIKCNKKSNCGHYVLLTKFKLNLFVSSWELAHITSASVTWSFRTIVLGHWHFDYKIR